MKTKSDDNQKSEKIHCQMSIVLVPVPEEQRDFWCAAVSAKLNELYEKARLLA